MSIHQGPKKIEQKRVADSFGDEYKLQVFLVWYNRGKPTADSLLDLIDSDPESSLIPTTSTLDDWIKESFVPKAIELDQQVADNIDHLLIAQRVEMADRHASIGKKLQEKGMAYLEDHDLTNVKDALAAVIRGVEIEHEARVLPTDILSKVGTMTDDQLFKELQKALQSGALIDITPNPDANSESS